MTQLGLFDSPAPPPSDKPRLTGYTPANFSWYVYTNMDLRGVNFYGCNLVGADFSGADLRGADLSQALVLYANFDGAQVEGTIFCGAQLEAGQLDHAHGQPILDRPEASFAAEVAWFNRKGNL